MFLFVLAASTALPLSAQEKDTAGGCGLGSPYNRRYDTNTEIAFSGRVVGIQRLIPLPGMSPGVMLLVRTPNGGTALVELGPAWFVDNQKAKVSMRDRVEVTGSKVFEDGKSSILARKIVRNNRVAYLRGVDGFPMWIASRGHVDVKLSGTPPNEVLKGTILRLEEVREGESGFKSQLVILETDAGTFAVDVGPEWFIERQGFWFPAGGELTVVALRVVRRAPPLLPLVIAGRVQRGDSALFLRPETGRPAWVGWGG
ncbi:MAG: hypothetical protein M9921_11740 [Fimbriimonadaceae bacterium]|nr:hypothetical protein [Fimbriimonadaceae bacterium]